MPQGKNTNWGKCGRASEKVWRLGCLSARGGENGFKEQESSEAGVSSSSSTLFKFQQEIKINVKVPSFFFLSQQSWVPSSRLFPGIGRI